MYYGASKDTILKARELRNSMTDAERQLWSRLSKKQFHGYIFRRQHPIDIYIVDFYCHDLKLVVEVDGNIHDTPENRAHDKGRSAELEKFGLKIIRFRNDEVLANMEYVLEKLFKFVENQS